MHGALPADETRPDPEQMRRWNRLSPSERIAIVDELRTFAIETRREQLRRQYPDWDEPTLERAVRRWFLCGSIGPMPATRGATSGREAP
jgi:hypothetical protein